MAPLRARYLIPGCVGRGISTWNGSIWHLTCVVESRIEKQGVQKILFQKQKKNAFQDFSPSASTGNESAWHIYCVFAARIETLNVPKLLFKKTF